MKITKPLLVLIIIGYCFSDSETDICEETFEDELKSKCEAIDVDKSCELTNFSEKCISKKNNDCSEGDGDKQYCDKIFPSDFPLYRCYYYTTTQRCEKEHTSCSNWHNGINGVNFQNNKTLCKDFYESNLKKECQLDNSGSYCFSYYKRCDETPSSSCSSNLPSDYKYKCQLNSDNECEQVPRICNETNLKNVDEKQCQDLISSDISKKKCIYSNGNCKEEYINCKDKNTCTGHPLNKTDDNFYYFDYRFQCVLNDSNNECETIPITCVNYTGTNASICSMHQAKDPTIKRCVFNTSATSNKCYEMFNECDDYNRQIETNRSGCESIIPKDPNEKCIYITEEDKCIKKSSIIEKECGDYTGNSKKICESIVLLPTSREYCILDKDSICKEKPLECSQAIDKIECLNIAKATDDNKRCAYKSDKCVEEYIRCEDFIDNTQSSTSSSGSSTCKGIKLYNGMICEQDSATGRCRSIYKYCSQADNEDECQLISKTGVSNPERKICFWGNYSENSTTSSPGCKEIYKYCSDYRGNNEHFCEQIKPYNDAGDEVEIKYKCKYEHGIGCQRIPVECTDAKNRIECNLFSNFIKDNTSKHCVYYDNKCQEYYRKCELVENVISNCTTNIIEGYLKNVCEIKDDKCVRKKDCRAFIDPSDTNADKYYKEICQSIHPKCSYSNSKCKYIERSCNETIFYPEFSKFNTDDEQKKLACENITASERYKKCVLKNDKSGCIEVYRELSYSSSYYSNSNPPDSTPQESSSKFITKRTHLIIILLCLLF